MRLPHSVEVKPGATMIVRKFLRALIVGCAFVCTPVFAVSHTIVSAQTYVGSPGIYQWDSPTFSYDQFFSSDFYLSSAPDDLVKVHFIWNKLSGKHFVPQGSWIVYESPSLPLHADVINLIDVYQNVKLPGIERGVITYAQADDNNWINWTHDGKSGAQYKATTPGEVIINFPTLNENTVGYTVPETSAVKYDVPTDSPVSYTVPEGVVKFEFDSTATKAGFIGGNVVQKAAAISWKHTLKPAKPTTE